MKAKYLIGGGLILLAAAFALSAWNIMDEERAARAAGKALAALESQQAEFPSGTSSEAKREVEKERKPVGTGGQTGEIPEESRVSETGEMPVLAVDGIEYIGVLKIPALDLELSVISQWSEETLKISPCRYMGSAYDGDLIIAGHNYRRHFGSLRLLETGDEIFLTGVDGRHFSYQVTSVERIPGTGVEEMQAGEWDLTLFTCTSGGKDRAAVRCSRQTKDAEKTP